jgi:condensin complex subunit 1
MQYTDRVKDKHTKALAGKLAQRLPKAENQKQWDEVAYTLSLFQHKDEDIQKTVAAGFKVVQTEA